MYSTLLNPVYKNLVFLDDVWATDIAAHLQLTEVRIDNTVLYYHSTFNVKILL